MDGEALKKKLQKMVLTPDEAPTIAQEIIADIDAVAAELGTASERIATLEQKTRDLQDTNMKLFLAQTSDKPDTKLDDEEKSIDDLEKEFIDLVKGGTENGN